MTSVHDDPEDPATIARVSRLGLIVGLIVSVVLDTPKRYRSTAFTHESARVA